MRGKWLLHPDTVVLPVVILNVCLPQVCLHLLDDESSSPHSLDAALKSRNTTHPQISSMAGQQEEAEGVYMEHQYMCSECHQLFNTLEDVLIHQQIHTGQEGEGEGEAMTIQGVQEIGQTQQYQCLECGTLLVNPEELLQHQEMHMREAGMEVEHQGE